MNSSYLHILSTYEQLSKSFHFSERCSKIEDLEKLDQPLKAATLHRLEEMSEPDEDEDPLKDWVGKEKTPVDTIIEIPHCNLILIEMMVFSKFNWFSCFFLTAASNGLTNQPETLAMPSRRFQARNGKSDNIPSSLHSVGSSREGSVDDTEDEEFNDAVDDTALHRRVKGETAEEKRARKAALKAQKRERQKARKANVANFRREQILLSKMNKPCTGGGGRIFVD